MLITARRVACARPLGFLGAVLLGIGVSGMAVAAAPTLPRTDPATLKAIEASVGGSQRPEKNRARDAYRHPLKTLEFFGLRREMSVIEIAPGGGWYTEILAPVLKEKGHYAAGVTPPKSMDAEDTAGMKALKQKFAEHAAAFGTLNTVPFGPDVAEMAPEGSVDMVVTFRNLHNWMDAGWADKALTLMFKALKHGGILGIEEHRGNPATPQDPKAKSGYVNEDFAIRMIEAAGFKLAGRSEVNANPKDTKDYAEGVWTLPPVLTLGDKDREKYQQIGESDRFTLKFRKP